MLLFEAGALLRPLLGEARLLVVTDSQVAPLYLDVQLQGLAAAGYEASSWIFPAGRSTAVFPPTEASTAARRVVGSCTQRMPRR